MYQQGERFFYLNKTYSGTGELLREGRIKLHIKIDDSLHEWELLRSNWPFDCLAVAYNTNPGICIYVQSKKSSAGLKFFHYMVFDPEGNEQSIYNNSCEVQCVLDNYLPVEQQCNMEYESEWFVFYPN
jgi:hypothetical protein